MNATIHIGDCLTTLRSLPSASVHCVVTSPPYWGLREYAAIARRRIDGVAPLFRRRTEGHG